MKTEGRYLAVPGNGTMWASISLINDVFIPTEIISQKMMERWYPEHVRQWVRRLWALPC